MSPTIITLFVISKAFSIFLFKESKKFEYSLVPRVFEIRSISQKCVFKIELKFGFILDFFHI